ncbi:ArnT family glycosyltransferase [Variovorax sp. PBL-E5]|uniref:ArnT family glycosyltransferase n=1 Tax=Variovorax sp. PBL-E5 TaxID=434014 RepID=UPI001318A96C|nr:glycosyltransferase family 39 protein [Variovorax sp. PBL-E5]VTU24204.1 Undecaprenyl phosphate-alpha-4-amino-4-deoxy-L-arabinose arabinosyl transferase [Variovorax sp. PBL-E5]
MHGAAPPERTTAPAPTSHRNTPSLRWLAWMAGLATLLWFASLGTRSLISPDEGRYATLALEMARSGDWITPRLNGLLYFEKPALQYWIGALSFKCLGITEFAARLGPGLAGFLTVIVVGWTSWRLWGREVGLQALAITASTTWIVGNSHFLTLDAGLTLFLTLALCSVLLAMRHDASPGRVAHDARRRWIWIAWAAMAGAVLSKGLIGIAIPGGVLLTISLWRRDMALLRGMRWGSGAVIFLALAAPWFVLMSLRHPEFANFFFIHEHFTRYLTTEHRREGAWWYYLPILLAGALPWTGGLAWSLKPDRRHGETDGPPIDSRNVLIVWSLFILLFFSASGSKLPSYILPMFPALAMLAALRIRDARPSTLRWHLGVPTLVWLAALIASTQYGRLVSPSAPPEALSAIAMAVRLACVVFLLGAAAAWWHLGRRQTTAAVLCMALGHFVATTLVLQGHDRFGQLKSSAALSTVLLPLLQPDTPVFAVRSYDQTLPFYLRRDVVLVDYADEFALGQRLEPWKSIPTLDAFAQRWRSLPQAAAYMNRTTWAALRQRELPMRIVFEDARCLVVVKQ